MGEKQRKNHQAAVILVAPVTFKYFPKSWRSPTTTEFGSQITSRIAWRARRFLKRFAFFFWKRGVDWNNTRVCFYFGGFFCQKALMACLTNNKNDCEGFHPILRKDHLFFRCLCQKNRPLLVSCFVLFGGELTDLVLKKMFFVTTLAPNFDYQDG